MQILEESEKATSEALRILEVGGVVAHATETCYGLACDMTNSEAIEKLFKIKNRPPDQPVSALFPSIEASKEWVEWSDEALELAEKELPGPLTIILPIKENKFNKIFPVPSTALLRYCANSLGIRVSPHPVAVDLAEKFGKPLSTTSANVSGKPSTYSIEEIEKQFSIINSQFSIDLIINSGPLAKHPPSRVVVFEGSKIKIIRE